MTIFEILKTVFCCGSSTVPPEEEPILPAADAGNGVPNVGAYIHIGDTGINTTVIEGLQVVVEDDAEDDYSLARTPTKNSAGTSSTHSSPGFSLGVNTPIQSRSQHRRTPFTPGFFEGEQSVLAGTTPMKQATGTESTPSSPGFSLGVHTPSHSSTRSVGSTHSSPGFSLGLSDDDDDDETITPQLVL